MINLIAAMDENRLIGANNTIPWHLSNDLGFFKTITVDKTIVMGRKTFESLGSKPLPNRRNIVLTRGLAIPSVETVSSVNAIVATPEVWGEEIFVIGGAEIYSHFLPHADRLYITHVEGEYTGDTYFPKFDNGLFTLKSTWKSSENGINFAVKVYTGY